eukprot:1965291-Rhodomonas_salina.2
MVGAREGAGKLPQRHSEGETHDSWLRAQSEAAWMADSECGGESTSYELDDKPQAEWEELPKTLDVALRRQPRDRAKGPVWSVAA